MRATKDASGACNGIFAGQVYLRPEQTPSQARRMIVSCEFSHVLRKQVYYNGVNREGADDNPVHR